MGSVRREAGRRRTLQAVSLVCRLGCVYIYSKSRRIVLALVRACHHLKNTILYVQFHAQAFIERQKMLHMCSNVIDMKVSEVVCI